MLRIAVHMLLIVALATGVWYGLRMATDYVHRLDRYQGPVDVVLHVKHRKDDVLIASRDIPDAQLPANARLIYREMDEATGRLVVDYNGRTVQVSVDEVSAEWLTRFGYVHEQLIGQARAIANALPTASSRSPDWFDAATASRIGQAAGSDPYVERVVQVDKQLVSPESDSQRFSRRVVLTVALRRPLAQIWYPPPGVSRAVPHAYVLDRTGFVLEERATAIADLPQVVGFALKAASAKQLRPGQTLAAPDVQAGLGLLARLSSRPYFAELALVDVANYGRRRSGVESELVLYTRPWQSLPAQAIWWGMREDSPVEHNNSLEKMQILQNIWATNGRLNVQDRYPGPYSLYHTRGLPFQPTADSAGSPRGERPAGGVGGNS